MKPYDHKTIESKWREYWNQNNVYKTLSADEAVSLGKKPYYVLDMFPYPSGAGLHVGHPRGYIASDVFARMKRMQGYNVLHPMGFDSFGLPTEQYAIQTGENPSEVSDNLVKRYKEQLTSLGFSYDWDRQVATHDPKYYKWTQWIFLQIYNSWYDTQLQKARPISELVEIFERENPDWNNLSELEKQNILMNYRLAYEGYAEVNWCPELGTVLANDEIVDDENGNPVSERGGHEVVKKSMRQWFMRITAYADRLLAGLETIDWSDSIKEIQKNWIGKQTDENGTTTYNIRDAIFARQRYWGEPIPLVHEKKQVPYFIDPDFPPKQEFGESVYRNNVSVILTNKNNQVLLLKWKQFPWVSFIGGGVENNEHIIDSGIREVIEETGYKNIKFVKQFEQVIHVESSADHKKQNRYANITLIHCELVDEEVIDINKEESDSFDLSWTDRDNVVNTITGPEAKALWEIFNTETVVNCDKWVSIDSGIIIQVPENNLPLELPHVDSYAPAGDGQSPLATVPEWVSAGYETNTMPGWAGSSWYFLRYTDPKNTEKFASSTELDYWFSETGGVDMYIGGTEHATGHLLYSRFWHKVLHDLGYVKTDEPFAALRNQGMILASDGRKMSKRWGNVINPDDMVHQFGADTMRIYEMFMGPFEASQPWSVDGMVGSRRFVERVWRIGETVSPETSIDVLKSLHKTIKKVTDDIVNFNFNTAVSAMMILVNEIEKQGSQISGADYKKFLQILAPFAPHITEEIWQGYLGETGSIHLAPWPDYDEQLIVENTITLGIQINGKVRGEIEIEKNLDENSVREQVLALPEIQKWTDNTEIKKFIYIPEKVISIVI